jgi:hypothetical protein
MGFISASKDTKDRYLPLPAIVQDVQDACLLRSIKKPDILMLLPISGKPSILLQ